MNNFKVEIYDNVNKEYVDYTSKAVFPLKFANLLDEQLDECELILKRVLTPFINPLTLVKVTITNSPKAKYLSASDIQNRSEDASVSIAFDSITKRITETKVLDFVVANDLAIEQPVGSGKYNHQLYLIETTKVLEGYIGDSISFTNSLGNSYSNKNPASYITSGEGDITLEKNPYYVINPIGEKEFVVDLNFEEYIDWAYFFYWTSTEVQIIDPSEKIIAERTINKIPAGNDITPIVLDIKEEGTYQVKYIINGFNATVDSFGRSYEASITFFLSFVNNRLPLKKWTVTDVINRIFDTVTPLFDNEKPQFRLKGVIYDDNGNPVGVEQLSTADKLEKILAPEMTFTKMTLREMLKQVGGFIHGEPRITAINYENGRRWYEVDFDFYGGFEYSNISKRKYVSATLRTDINEFCTSLDSSADNLVNRLDWASGVVVEPFIDGRRSLRTETTTVRMEESNMFIATDLPIDTIYRIEYVYGEYGMEETTGTPIEPISVDITPYLFESADYNNLSSYDGTYPYSKAYGIYYTYGQNNIKGLFFKAPHAISSIFHQYAIRNIITSANPAATFPDNYAKMSFRVSYLPIYSERIRTNKQTIVSGIPRTLAYNQGANLIETRYYGENLKGAIARMGNVEKTYTYNLAFISDIPKAGMLFDDNYYISSVSTEILPTYIRCTIGLSKDFNRLSQYVGISSEKRMWEISERQAFNRDTVINNTIVVSEKADYTFTNPNTLINKNLPIAKTLFNQNEVLGVVNLSNIKRYRKDGGEIGPDNPISLPVLSVAMGNSMLFTIRFEDSYSAGQKSVKVDGDGSDNDDVTGYWGAYVSYGNYYGRIYYLSLQMYLGYISLPDGDTPRETASLNFPNIEPDDNDNERLLNGAIKIKYRKDSKEIPAITVEINTVTDDPSIIIGSALAKNCSLVNQNPQEYELWLSVNRINTISSSVDFSYATLFNGFTINDNNIVLPDISEFDKNFKSWAIVTRRKEIKIQVEDDNGKTITQTIYEGGELVLGGNNSLKNGKTLYFHLGRDVYD